MEPGRGGGRSEGRLYAGLGVLAGVGAFTGLVEGPGSVAVTGAPFALLDALAAHGHHALLIGLLAAHNLGVAATLPALGRFVAGRTEAGARTATLRVLFASGLVALGLTALLVPPTRAALPIFVLEALAVLALAVPAYRALAAGATAAVQPRAALAPWCVVALLLVVAAAALEIRLFGGALV